MNSARKIFMLISLVLLSVESGSAAQRIAVLDFELNDITSLPNTPAERQRTASMAPLLIDVLRQQGDYEIVAVDAGTQRSASAGFGYLFRFHDVAADLGRRLGADWMIVGQHSKPSFLVSYLMAYLIRVKSQTIVARYDIELKGNHEKVTRRSIRTLAGKIRESIKKQPDATSSHPVGLHGD